MGCPKGTTEDGFERQMGINHFGHFLLFQLLKSILLRSSTPEFGSRVVTVSSAAHRTSPIRFDDMDFSKNGYDPWVAYGQSKTANIYLANSIERHYSSKDLHGYSVHPGVILVTGIARHVEAADYGRIKALLSHAQRIAKTSAQGAATQIWAATSRQLEGHGGVYLADVGQAEPSDDNIKPGLPGYAAHAYDEESEEKLWKLSYEAVGLPAED